LEEAAVEADKKQHLNAEPAWRKAYRAALEERHGAAKAAEVLGYSRHNTIVYPNLFINPGLQQIRYLVPSAVDCTEQHGFVFRLKGAPDELLHLAVRALNVANSPASLVTSDDHEVFERMQESMRSGQRSWIDWSRGLDSEKKLEDGSRTGGGTNEVLMRNQLKAWMEYMTEAHQ